MRYFSRVVGARADGRGGGSRGTVLRPLVLLLAAVVAGIAILGARSEAQDGTGALRKASAYDDPNRAIMSYLLSDVRNVEEFQRTFDLSDMEVEKVLARTRLENKSLAELYAESERIVGSKKGLSLIQKRRLISDFRYNEKMREIIDETKKDVTLALPENERNKLPGWVDEQWTEEIRDHSAPTTEQTTRDARSAPATFKVFATQYEGYTRFEMALPHRKLKFAGGFSAVISCKPGDNGHPRGVANSQNCNGRLVRVPIKEVGPWNTYDNWWDSVARRSMWKDLPRGIPEAEAAFFDRYNGKKDEIGRIVGNPAGADLTPAAAARLGLTKYENAWITVRMPRRTSS